jgi:hypothetical protein
MKISADETLFAWERRAEPPAISTFSGLLATSPDVFFHSTSIDRHKSLFGSIQRTTPFSVTNMGLRLEVMLLKASDTRGTFCFGGAPLELTYEMFPTYIIVLNCYKVDSTSLIGITGCFPEGYEKSRPNNQFVRYSESSYGGLVLLDTNTYQPSGRERATIFAATWDSGSPHRYNGRYRSSDHQWLRMGPKGFRLVEIWPPNPLKDQELHFSSNVKLLFDNGVDVFVIHSFVGYEEDMSVQVSLCSPGSLLGDPSKEIYPREEIALVGNYCDRVSYKLSSGRMVYVFIRPQRVGQNVGYGLYITVDEPQLVYSPPTADVVES